MTRKRVANTFCTIKCEGVLVVNFPKRGNIFQVVRYVADCIDQALRDDAGFRMDRKVTFLGFVSTGVAYNVEKSDRRLTPNGYR